MKDEINKYLVFSGQNGLYAVLFKYIREIVSSRNIMRTDYLCPLVFGMANIKGEVVPILNLFAQTATELCPYQIVVHLDELVFSFQAQEVVDTLLLQHTYLKELRSNQTPYIYQYFYFRKHAVSVLDLERYLDYMDQVLDKSTY